VPRSFTEIVLGSLASCSAPARRLVEAAAVLGRRSPLALAARLAGIDEPFDALEQAVAARLLAPDAGTDEYEATFPHPLIETAVYRQIGAARRARLHAEAAALVEDPAVALRHRVAAAPGPDPELADELAGFARREEARAAWANVAWALAAAARLSESRGVREPRMLAAAEATLLSGDLEGASRLSERVSDPANPPLRDCVLAFVALLGPRPLEAEPLLERAWRECDPEADPDTAARVASTTALLRLMQMRGPDTEAWSRRAIALTPAPSKVQDQLMTAIGVMLAGRMAEAEALARAMLAENPDASELLSGLGWVLLARDDLAGATVELTRAAAAARRNGSFEQAALAHAHLCRAEYMAGRWDAALAQSEQSLALMAELPNLNVRPMVHWSATLVPAARGDWAATEELGRLAALDAAGTLDRALVAGLVRALPAAARGDHATVIAALEPFAAGETRSAIAAGETRSAIAAGETRSAIAAGETRSAIAAGQAGDGIHEPGVWPWHDLYAEALVAAGRLDDAAAFLPAHERRARERGLGSALARLGRARGRLEAARGEIDAAVGALAAAIEHARLAGVPFERARAELALGALLRRQGRRREAADHLRSAHATLTDLAATPYLARCDRELSACGLTPMKRSRPEPTRLTPQERSVAELVASGMTNREVATELLVSVKTVEVHLTRIYAKLGITSRGQLAAGGWDRAPADLRVTTG
jgi:DNA-binding CsgD family transcriptional regulator